MGKNRDRVDIVAAVLTASNSGARKTRIMNMAHLSYSLLEKYLDIVAAAGFVRVEGSSYMLTAHGRAFLEHYRRFHEHYVQMQKLLDVVVCERKTLVIMCQDFH